MEHNRHSTKCCALIPSPSPHPSIKRLKARSDNPTDPSGPHFRLYPLGHEPMQLVEETINTFDPHSQFADATRLVHLGAWEQWKQCWFEDKYEPTLLGPDPDEDLSPKRIGLYALEEQDDYNRDLQELLSSALPILNALFFCNAIRDPQIQLERRIDPTTAAGGENGEEIYGCASLAQWPHVDTMLIRIAGPPHEYSIDTTALSARSLIGTLLHEMAHAYLKQYICVGNAYGCGQRVCRKRYLPIHGVTWHGPAFMELASAIENASSDILGLRVDMGLRDSLIRESKARTAGMKYALRSQVLLGTSHLGLGWDAEADTNPNLDLPDDSNNGNDYDEWNHVGLQANIDPRKNRPKGWPVPLWRPSRQRWCKRVSHFRTEGIDRTKFLRHRSRKDEDRVYFPWNIKWHCEKALEEGKRDLRTVLLMWYWMKRGCI